MIDAFFNYASSSVIKKNKKFFNLHEGEECYLFGNGHSIQYFDLSKFADKISFGCNLLSMHKDVSELDLRYYIETHPFIFGKYWRGVKGGFHIEENPFYKYYHSMKNEDYEKFIHVSNYPFTKNYNKFSYVHNFKRYDLSLDTLNFSLSSSFAAGGLITMIGLAIYMGFKKIYLVGCDYWFAPRGERHFYFNGDSPCSEGDFLYSDLMNIISSKVELVVVTRYGVKSPVNYIEYSDLTGVDEKRKLAGEIVSSENLAFLEKARYLRN